MNCRNCGAAMQPVGGRAYFRCQHCTTFEFPATAEDGVVTLDELTDLDCPVCFSKLSSAAMEGHTINFCGHCRGVLTSNALFSQIVTQRRAKNIEYTAAPAPIGRTEFQRRLQCPQCMSRMDTHPYGGGGAVVVDTCCRCHLIWLDAGEIDDIARHRPHGKPAHEPILLTSTAGSCREPEPTWQWGGDSNWNSPYTNDDNGIGIWDLIKRLI